MNKKLMLTLAVTAVWSSSAFAVCEAEQREYDDIPRQCAKLWTIQNDINQCINEEREIKEKALRQCFVDVNAGKRER